jgi:hypothetical protein
MTRRGGRGRRRARRERERERQDAAERWARWRDRPDRVLEDREAEALRVELQRLAQQPRWRVRP